MALPRASRRLPPRPLLLLPLLLLLLLPPAAPGTRGPPPSPARGAPLAGAEPARPSPPGPGREPQSPPPTRPKERRGPAPPGPRRTARAQDAAPRPGPAGLAPRDGSAAAVKNRWPESSTEPHRENTTFDRGPAGFSSAPSGGGVMARPLGGSSALVGAAEDFTAQAGEAGAQGGNSASRRADVTPFPVGPETATALTSQSSPPASGRAPLPSRSMGSRRGSTPSHPEHRTPWGSLARGQGSTEAATSVLSQSSLPASVTRGEPTLPGKRSSSEPEVSRLPLSRMAAYSSPLDRPAASTSAEELSASPAHRSPFLSRTGSAPVASTLPSGGPRAFQSLPVSLVPLTRAEGFPEDPEVASTPAAVRSSPPEAEPGRSAGAVRNPGPDELAEASTENRQGLSSSESSVGFWPNDSPVSGGHPPACSPDTEDGSRVGESQTETAPWPVPLNGAGGNTALWVLSNSRTFADVTGSSASYPGAVNSSVLTRFSASVLPPRGSDAARSEKSFLELAAEPLSSSSSSESLESSAPRGERSTTEDSPEPGVHAGVQRASEGTSRLPGRSPHTPATLAGNGERTLRSLTNTSVALGGEGSSEVAPGEAESILLQGNVTETSMGATLRGVTGMSYDHVRGSNAKQEPASSHTDHAYVSSTFSKGERALLSIVDSSSPADARESATSPVKTSDSSHSDPPSSSQVRMERRNISSYGGERAQPSTEPLGLRTASLLPSTPTVNAPRTVVLLGTRTGAGDSSPSSSGPPWPLPSASQPLRSSSPPSRAFARPPESTSDVPAPLSSSLPPLPVSPAVSTPASLSVSQTALPSWSSTLALPRAKSAPGTVAWARTSVSSVTVLARGQTADPNKEGGPSATAEQTFTESKRPSPPSLPTQATEAETVSLPSGVPLLPTLTESSTEQTPSATSTSLVQTPTASTAMALQASHPSVSTAGPSSRTATPVAGPRAAQTTARKEFLPTSPEILVPRVPTEGAAVTKRNPVPMDNTTPLSSLTSVPTSSEVEVTAGPGASEAHRPTSRFLGTSPSPRSTGAPPAAVLTPKPTAFPAESSTRSPAASGNSCAPNPCLHDGKCSADAAGAGYRCVCSPSWRGPDCSEDVNECLANPCPPLAACSNTQGAFACRCPLGYQLEKGVCSLVRTFVTEFKLKKMFLNATAITQSGLHELENEIAGTLDTCFSTLPGYTQSTVRASREPSAVLMSLQTTFALASNVTLFDLADGLQQCVNSCRASLEVCQLFGSQRRIFRAGSLCKRKTPECDKETSICTDLDGVALCQCKSGYFQFNKMDHSCRACEDGYRLENETCLSCPFGLGGLNCGNPYQLVTVVIAAAGGGLLLILGIALIVTCCRKNKNDISKLIFKSGDFQMSPYAEYPKNPRPQEWGREAIEMHENGSTKNLLQVTDVYCPPTSVRNPELERNGLYPAYTGLPGSRHSCIFPGQYNPSFISDESRRRDYF